MKAFHRRGLGEIGAVRIHPATPREDAHIESFSVILEKEVMRSFEFNSFTHAEQTISRFINFYNNERLHSGVGYCAPRQAYLKWKGISEGGLQ
jgi:putative transposase